MGSLVRLRPRPDVLYLSRGRTVLATDRAGAIDERRAHGLFVHETRVLSRHDLLIDGRAPYPVALSNIEQGSWLGYYITCPRELATADADDESARVSEASQQTLEIRISRAVGEGLHEDIDITNFTQAHISFQLDVGFDADFADLIEAGRARSQSGTLTWTSRHEASSVELECSYMAEHAFDHQGERGVARLERGVLIRLDRSDSQPLVEGRRVRFAIQLPPHGTWHTCVRVVPHIEGQTLQPPASCVAWLLEEANQRSPTSLHAATRFSSAHVDPFAATVIATLDQARSDLHALRLPDLDHGDDGWTMAAGLPLYVALFGRDTLTTAWQAALIGPEMMRGTLMELARWQGTTTNDWRDEQPGRMLHEAHTGPAEVLNFNPRARSYSSITTSAFYPVIVAELWHWTGDIDVTRQLVPSALRAIDWLDRGCDRDRKGFRQYQTRSTQGVEHQAWKDSGDAIVDDAGRQVPPPIATCEEQAFAYIAKFLLAEVLWSLGEKHHAMRLFRAARDLKARFNEAFWMEDLGYIALGLDRTGRQIRAVTSNPGHCLAAGIIDEALARRTADRLMLDDLFSGWGVRTLSAWNPAYNPYSYHRGSVWPVEQGTFLLGFMRYGLQQHAQRLARAQFEAAALFDFCRLPELFSGHARDAQHPFPALYPQANSPQAWSASAVFMIVQALLGLYPYAPFHLLIVDPHLPDWLPDLTLSNLRIGEARATIRFFRDRDGVSDYRVLDLHGTLHVIRLPSPWSLTAGAGERIRDLLWSMLPGR